MDEVISKIDKVIRSCDYNIDLLNVTVKWLGIIADVDSHYKEEILARIDWINDFLYSESF